MHSTPRPFEGSRLAEFAAQARERYGIEAGDYRAVHAWSTEHPEQFWASAWDYFGIPAHEPPRSILSDAQMPGARWFDGAQLNYVDSVLRHRDLPGEAVVSLAEDGRRAAITWADLPAQVLAFATTLRRLGVEPGDRVVGQLTACAESVVAFLGCASLGAVWSGCGPDLGVETAASRLAQLDPAVLVTVTGYTWGGRTHDRRAETAELAARLGVRAVVVVDHLGLGMPDAGEAELLTWEEALAAGASGEDRLTAPAPVAADHPLWVLFSSGTTGVPKGIIHGHGGITAAHHVALALHHDLGPGHTLFWYTTTNWMMWNLVVSALLVGTRTVLYEGNPFHPGPDRLWQIVADEQVTAFGTSPGHLQATRAAGLRPGADHDLMNLDQIAVTGAPVPASLFEWAREAVGADVPVVSTSGGTDVAAGFVGGAPGLPVVDGEISGPLLGVATASFDDAASPVVDQVGELVITRPYPSMPLGFWNDPDGARYRDAYFSTYPGVWRQGDWATHTSRGTVIIHGRSDSTLNRNGVRFGSSDLYNIVEKDPAVAEALVLGVELAEGGYRMPMFLVPAAGRTLDDAELDRLRGLLRTEGSPRHVPDEMHVVEAIPHTRTGKKLEVPLKRILQGAKAADVLDPGAVDRPDLIGYYVDLAGEWARRDGRASTGEA